MPPIYTRADTLREYLTGAGSDGGAQSNPLLSLGGFRSSTEAPSMGVTLVGSITGVSVLFAGGRNPAGAGVLTAVDANNLVWKPQGATVAGPPSFVSGSPGYCIVEAADNPGQYLRLSANTPLTPSACTVDLAVLADNYFGFDDVSAALAASGVSEYRASIVRNEGTGDVTSWTRWLNALTGPQTTDNNQLPASGAGTINTSGSYAGWPAAGWCQVRTSSGTLRETVYYTSRTNTSLTVPSAGRALLGTTSAAGLSTDSVTATPGVAMALDPTGVVAFGNSIQTVANANTAPAGVTWNQEITSNLGLSLADIPVGSQFGLWLWRQVPAGAISAPLLLTQFNEQFNAF